MSTHSPKASLLKYIYLLTLEDFECVELVGAAVDSAVETAEYSAAELVEYTLINLQLFFRGY